MQIKVIFIRMVSHLDSLWNRGTRELGNGLSRKDNLLQAVLSEEKFKSTSLHMSEVTRIARSGDERTSYEALFQLSEDSSTVLCLILIFWA